MLLNPMSVWSGNYNCTQGRERRKREKHEAGNSKKLTDERECGKCRFTKLEYPLAKLSVHGFGGHKSGQRGVATGILASKKCKKKSEKDSLSE